jgi:hypothetical protein
MQPRTAPHASDPAHEQVGYGSLDDRSEETLEFRPTQPRPFGFMSATGRSDPAGVEAPTPLRDQWEQGPSDGTDATSIARLVLDATRLASRARSGAPFDAEEVRRFRESAAPVISVGLKQLGRFAQQHKPTPAQLASARAAAGRAAEAGRSHAAGYLHAAREAAVDADASSDDGDELAVGPRLSTRSWLCKRAYFAAFHPGTFSLRDGRILFVTDDLETAIDIPVEKLAGARFSWFSGSFTATFGTQRWTISFQGPATHSRLKGVQQMTIAIPALKAWKQALEGLGAATQADDSDSDKEPAPKPRRDPRPDAMASASVQNQRRMAPSAATRLRSGAR